MDIYFQNGLGFDVYVTVETTSDGAVTARLHPKRLRPKRGMLVQMLLKPGETAIAADQPDETKVAFDLTALSFRVRIEKRVASDGDVLYEFKLQNGHGHAP